MKEPVTNSPMCVYLYVYVSVCVLFIQTFCVCVCVLLGMIEWVWQLCQGCGYSPARGRGRGAQILHYGLIHHPWDSLALLTNPPPLSIHLPLTLLLSTYSCTGLSSCISSPPFTSALSPQCTFPGLFFSLVSCSGACSLCSSVF